MTKIISCFPGTGKTYYQQNSPLRVLDSDSSTFDKEHFPQNYLEHIKENIGKVDVILVSTHEEIRHAMRVAGIVYTLVYPHANCKDEYLQRYIDRGSPDSFVQLMEENWYQFLESCWEDYGYAYMIELNEGQFLTDAFHLLPPEA